MSLNSLTMILIHKFVEYIPDEIEEGVLYISIQFCIAIHKCVCGCGNEVATPISRDGWKLSFDGESVSLSPSIGSWNLECKSHYFIINNTVRFAKRWRDDVVELKQNSMVKKRKKSKKKSHNLKQ